MLLGGVVPDVLLRSSSHIIIGTSKSTVPLLIIYMRKLRTSDWLKTCGEGATRSSFSGFSSLTTIEVSSKIQLQQLQTKVQDLNQSLTATREAAHTAKRKWYQVSGFTSKNCYYTYFNLGKQLKVNCHDLGMEGVIFSFGQTQLLDTPGTHLPFKQGSGLTDEYEKNGLMFVEVPRTVHKGPFKSQTFA